jgi:hypothetical protein
VEETIHPEPSGLWVGGGILNFVFVHGIKQGKESSAKLKKLWLGALKPRTLSSVAVPFYGRKLDQFVEGHRGSESKSSYDAFVAEFAADVSGVPITEIKDVQKRGSVDRDIQNFWIARALARVSDQRLPLLADAFVTGFLKDVHTYLCDAEAKRLVDQIVRNDIADMSKVGPTVVVGHSLGSVVAYNVLRAAQFENVFHYVTLGSPLGISAVLKRLPTYQDGRQLSIEEWFNGFDHRDIVALNPLDGGALASKCEIHNVNDLDNTTSNRHGIIGYLGIEKVASYLVDELGAAK